MRAVTASAMLLGTGLAVQASESVPGTEVGDYLSASYDVMSTWSSGSDSPAGQPAGTTTVRVFVGRHSGSKDTAYPGNSAPKSIYTIFGDSRSPLVFPPAYHSPAPFGCDIGGTDPRLHAIPGGETAKYDSWLTVGVTEGNSQNAISSIGIDWDSWTPNWPGPPSEAVGQLSVDDGAVFWMDPDDAPSFEQFGDKTPVAQLTVRHDSHAIVSINGQGRCVDEGTEDWEEVGLLLTLFPETGPPPSPSPEPTLDPTHSRAACNTITPRSSPSLGEVCGCQVPGDCPTLNQVKDPSPLCRGPVCTQEDAFTCCVMRPPPSPPGSTDGNCNGDPVPANPSYGHYTVPMVDGHAKIFRTGDTMRLSCDAGYIPSTHLSGQSSIFCGSAGWTESVLGTGFPQFPTCRLREEIPPSPPPSHDDCETSSMMSACCMQPGQDCSAGTPNVCGATCHRAVQSFSILCPVGAQQITNFIDMCETSNAGNSGISGTIDNLNHHGNGQNAYTYDCTYAELTGISLVCSSVLLTSSSFCNTGCVAQLKPFMQQCGDTMARPLQDFGLLDMATQALSLCTGVNAPDTHSCPIDDIMAQCATLSAPGGDAFSLCNTQCMQIMSLHFAACAKSTDSHVSEVFSADNWRPLVDLCGEDTGATDIASQCANIQGHVVPQIASACCEDSLCAQPRTTCSEQCSLILLPYFRDCGSQLLASDPMLMGRITSLTSICYNAGH